MRGDSLQPLPIARAVATGAGGGPSVRRTSRCSRPDDMTVSDLSDSSWPRASSRSTEAASRSALDAGRRGPETESRA